MSTDSLVPSSQRPIPLRGRPDLDIADVAYLGVGYRVVKDPVGLQYYRLQVEQFRVLELLDGKRSLEQLRDDLRIDYPTLRLTLSDLQQLITDFHQKGLLQSDRFGQGPALVRERRNQKRRKLLGNLRSLLYLRLPGWDPERTLQWMYPWTKWMFHPVCVTLCALFVLSSWVLLAVHFETFRSRIPEFEQFFGWPNLMYMWITLGLAKIIHEFGHGLSCKHYRGECHEMGVMLLVFSPCLYCDVTDSWMLKNKWQRIIIGAAGMYIEIILSAIAIYVWYYTNTGLLHHLALNVFFVTTITTVIFNANPLMRFDGYYMMSDFLEIPNLRRKSDTMLREAFGWYCLGIESRPDPFMPETGRGWFVTYAIAAWLYRWVILIAISMFLYTVLKPIELQSIGVTLCVVSMAGIIFTMFQNIYKLIAAPRIEPMSKPKIAFTLVVLCGVIWAGLSIPIPWHIEAPLLVEPYDEYKVSMTTPGQMLTPEQLHEQRVDPRESEYSVARCLQPDEYTTPVRPGDTVSNGQVLAVVENIKLQDRLRDLKARVEIQKREVRLHEPDVLADSSQHRIALEELRRIRKSIDVLETQLADRIIRAKIDGTIVAAPGRPKPKLDETTRTELTQWWGTPLDDRNRNCFLETGTQLCSIVPGSELQAVLYVDQGDRNDLDENDLVQLRIENIPDVIYEGYVAESSPRPETHAPKPLTSSFGGQLSTVTDDDGREKLVSGAYRTTVLITADTELMTPGLRGLGRFLVDERTAGDWLWRYIRRTFQFRL